MAKKNDPSDYQQITFKLLKKDAERIWKMVRKEMMRLNYPIKDVKFRARR